jgi:hypothetical protein
MLTLNPRTTGRLIHDAPIALEPFRRSLSRSLFTSSGSTVLTYISCRIFGTNIPGKKRCLRFYFGGLEKYRQELDDCIRNGYTGFKPFADSSVSSKYTPMVGHIDSAIKA